MRARPSIARDRPGSSLRWPCQARRPRQTKALQMKVLLFLRKPVSALAIGLETIYSYVLIFQPWKAAHPAQLEMAQALARGVVTRGGSTEGRLNYGTNAPQFPPWRLLSTALVVLSATAGENSSQRPMVCFAFPCLRHGARQQGGQVIPSAGKRKA